MRSPLHHQDNMRAHYRRQPMRNHEDGTAGAQCPNGLLDQALRLRVHGARGLIQNHNLGPPENDPRNGQAPQLAAAEAHPALPQLGPIRAAVPGDLCFWGARSRVERVLHKSPRDGTENIAEASQGHVANVLAVNGDGLCGGYVVEVQKFSLVDLAPLVSPTSATHWPGWAVKETSWSIGLAVS
ncbi:hypothetical protein E4U33_000171 [Claviceps sp. LM78 group G4]|nr:hypothetical protein E4U33_000171 [Claviceps sp. LM78 group G4]